MNRLAPKSLAILGLAVALQAGNARADLRAIPEAEVAEASHRVELSLRDYLAEGKTRQTVLATKATPDYTESRTRVLQTLAQQGQANAQISIDAMLKAFKVHLDPRFGTWGLSPNGQGVKVYEVTPPKAPKPSTVREGTTTTTPLGRAFRVGNCCHQRAVSR